MKAAAALLFLALWGSIESSSVFDRTLDTQWMSFKKVYYKFYSPLEERTRRLIWEKNVAEISRHNLNFDLGQYSFRKGLNEFADMSHDEFVKTMNGYRQSLKHTTRNTAAAFSNLALPDAVDWRKEGYVTDVKNQMQCGSCWAFSLTGTLEGQNKRKTGVLVSLSEQNLVDCAGPEGNVGCEGGLMDYGYEYVIKNGGIDSEASYPFEGKDGTCRYKPPPAATCTGYVDLPSGDENSLQNAVATVGPIAVAVDASQFSFQLYSGGVYDEPQCSSELLDHGVLVVGYGTEDGKDYWIVKNSWGTSWGESGYIRMARNKSNQCGIATDASYPTG